MEEIPYPIRINRYLYLTGLSSRRQADKLVEGGNILINGKQALIGQKVEKGDVVEVRGAAKNILKTYRYYAFNKPRGIVSHNPQEGEKSVENIFKPGIKVSPVGRLDKDSRGLMLLTNDGRIVDKMLNPKYDHEKEYIVQVNKELKESFKTKMEKGVFIEGYKTKPAKVRILSERTFSITLTEGKKHQIRRMCTALGYEVRDLKRTRIGVMRLDGIKEGQAREIKNQELEALLSSIGIEK